VRSIDPLAVAIPDPNRDGSRGHRCLAASPPEGDRGSGIRNERLSTYEPPQTPKGISVTAG
jgi:hypothetical protein